MFDAFLVPEKTTVTAKGDGQALDISAAASAVFLVTLSITAVVEQESIEISLFTSPDGAAWETKPVTAFPQKFYVGEHPFLADLSASPNAKFLRAHWEVSRWGRGPTSPKFEFGLRIREVSREALQEAQAEAAAGARTRLMPQPNSVIVRPARNLLGSLRVPGDKSISHRYAMLAALAEGRSRFENFAPGADCASTLGCLRALGCSVERDAQGTVIIGGLGPQLPWPSATFDCGNSGSTMRMLAGIVASQPFDSVMVGDESLSRRPMKRIIEPLTRMGARIHAADGDCAPLLIQGTKLHGIEYQVPIASAQVKTSVLFAGLLAEGTTVIEEPARTRDHGELALRAFGVTVNRSGNTVSIQGGQALHPLEAFVPGDMSSAAFFLCGASIFPESNLVLDGVLLNPTRSALLDVLTAMGSRVSMVRVEEHNGELVGTITLVPGSGRPVTIAGPQTALLIDELPVLAAIAPFAGGLEVRDAGELRVKESDRLSAVTQNLRAMGGEVEQIADGWRIPGGQKLHGADIESFHDHRIAMAFAIAALRAEGESVIRDADCVAISYPGFFEDLERLLER